MRAKLTLEKAQKICVDRGFKPLFNEYVGSKYKILVKCRCGKECKLTFNDIQTKHTKSCGHCNDPKIGDKINALTIIEVKPSPTGGCKIRCKCNCGNITNWLHSCVCTNDNTKSCGHCNDLKIGDKFNKLTIIKVTPSTSYGCSVKCQCDCGNTTGWYTANVIKTGNTTSCGHCNDPKIGDRFDKLTIVDINPSKQHGCCVKCMCDCGNECYLKFSAIKYGRNRSCGNCYLHRNGRFTSQIALDLHEKIEQITNQKWEHNFHIKGIGCVDIANPEIKIAIEYDGYYWHRVHNNFKEKDNDKIHRLVKMGWKVLHIKSKGRDIPTEKQLQTVLLNDFQHGVRKRTITMKSWKKEEEKRKNV
jgi:very-short-patch-repair endonuclease